jgi:hypothetical protein
MFISSKLKRDFYLLSILVLIFWTPLTLFYLRYNFGEFGQTKLPSPPCSSVLNSVGSLRDTLNCLDKNQFPTTNQTYQEILKFNQQPQLDQIEQIKQIKYNLLREEFWLEFRPYITFLWLLLTAMMVFNIRFLTYLGSPLKGEE